MLDTVQGLRRAQQADNRVAFQGEQLVLAKGLGGVHLTAGQHVGQFLTYGDIMVGGFAGTMKVIQSQCHGRFARGSRQGEFARFGWRIVLRHDERTFLGICQQAVAVHDDVVARP